MNQKALSQEYISLLTGILGESNLKLDAASLDKYGRDETEDLCFPPQAVAIPENSEQVQKVLALSYQHKVPVTPRGAGTGLSGGALPVHGGLSLSLEKLNKITEIDLENLTVTVQAGVITEVLKAAVEEHGLFYPPDPASGGSCFIGGNIAECSGGPRAVKYGVTKDYVLGMEVILPNGEKIRHGGKLLKNVTGFNISQLMVGSEGTLGIVTEITFRLIPLPKERVLMLVPFPELQDAARCVSALFRAGVVPSACELMEQEAVRCSESHLGIKFPANAVEAAGVLIIETDGNIPGIAMQEAEQVTEICMNHKATDVILADSTEKQKEIWRLRKATGEAVKKHSIYKEEDTVVPRARLPELAIGVKKICKEYSIESVCYGHAGDGNLHVNILKNQLSDEEWRTRVPEAIVKIFELTVSLGGTISGEHGIGYVQKEYLPIAYNESEIALMKKIKNAFDPARLLNPGKWV